MWESEREAGGWKNKNIVDRVQGRSFQFRSWGELCCRHKHKTQYTEHSTALEALYGGRTFEA